MKYAVTGTNERGEPISETIEVVAATRWQQIKAALVCVLGMRLAARLGLTKFKYIHRIVPKAWTVDRDGRVHVADRKIELRAR